MESIEPGIGFVLWVHLPTTWERMGGGVATGEVLPDSGRSMPVTSFHPRLQAGQPANTDNFRLMSRRSKPAQSWEEGWVGGMLSLRIYGADSANGRETAAF